MAIAMTILGIGALIGGVVQIPGVTDLLEQFFRGTFESSPLFHIVPSTGASWLGLLIGGLISIAGIAIAYYCYVARPGVTARLIDRFDAVHAFLLHKWYFDELQDALVYRPALALGRFANSVFERLVVDGIVSSPPGSPVGRARWSATPSRGSSAPTRCCWSAASPRSASISWW